MYGMNQGFNAPDPSAQVPNQLLPHIHLLSSYRFPLLPALPPAHALDYLTKAPSIVRNASAVAWHYFASPPADGTVILAWQPPRLGSHFASDGLVWADAEVAYDMTVKGYQMQVLVHKSGYQYPQEPFAVHARYRYRLTNGPGAFDPNLWIVHYIAAEPSLRIPAAQIPMSREAHSQLTMRASLQSAGQLVRKEFMLHDSANWPKVEFAPPAARGVQQAYYNPMQPGARPYPTQPPPAKRQRLPNPPTRQPVLGALAADTSLEEEENATQDSFDFMTPREISLSRYRQHHEWMEEIFSSPHTIGKIMPIDLGLGLMGELAPLTVDILDVSAGDAPIDANGEVNPDYGKKIKDYRKLQPEQLKEFESRVSAYLMKENTELDRMKTAHAKKMADLKRSRTYIKAERRLRDQLHTVNVSSVEENGTDPFKAVVHDLEKSLGVEFDSRKLVVCVDKGGFIEGQQPQPRKSYVNGNGLTANSNGGSSGGVNVGGLEDNDTVGSLLEQFGTGSLAGTPGANLFVPGLSQPQSQSQFAIATPNAPVVAIAYASSYDGPATTLDAADGGDDLLDIAQHPTSGVAPAHTSTMPTSGMDAEAGGIFDSADFGSFDNLDTAGDALADYATVGDDDMGLDLVDDSAFGDAFHGMTANGNNA